MKKISSVHNEEIKAVAHLSTKKGREEQHRFVAEGFRVCQTLIESGLELIQLYVTQAAVSHAVELCREHFITLIEDPVLKKISSAVTPSGIVAVFKIPAGPSNELVSSGLVLYDCTDPGNMGTLLRTCAAMGKKTAVVIDGADPWSPKVVQASAGTLGTLHIFQWTWQQLMAYKKNNTLCALVVQGGQKPDEINFSDILIVVGNEAHGIPEALVAQCDIHMTLEMPGKTESLNAAVAGSIALYLARNT